MILEEFELKFKKSKRFENYYYHGLCVLFIGVSVYFFYGILTGRPVILDPWKKLVSYFAPIPFFLLGIYGFYVLRSKYKLSFWYNELSKEENIRILKLTVSELFDKEISLEDNYTRFIYVKSSWTLPFEIHVFADTNVIAIHVKSIGQYHNSGFIDFGAAKRTQNSILDMLKEKAGTGQIFSY